MPILPKNDDKICLKEMINDYNRNKYLTGKSQNYCLICKNFYDAYSKNSFYELPEILIVYPGRKKYGIKYNIEIIFEEKLNIKLSDNLDNKIITYNLIGILYHLGGIGYSGHNIAYCKIKNNWYEFNDSVVTEIDIRDISGKGVLLLIYQKLNQWEIC